MRQICFKINCCGCPNADACNSVRYNKLLYDFFCKYSSPSEEEASKTFHIWQPHPSKIHKTSDIVRHLERADRDIEQLEECILQLKAYKIALTERYNYLETAPRKTKIKLKREKKYQGNVFYYIIFYDVDLETGEETETKRTTFRGAERAQAIAVFEDLKKEHKNFIFEMDIKKRAYER